MCRWIINKPLHIHAQLSLGPEANGKTENLVLLHNGDVRVSDAGWLYK